MAVQGLEKIASRASSPGEYPGSPYHLLPWTTFDTERRQALLAIGWFIWAASAVEYVIRLAVTLGSLRFVLRRWLDMLIILLPFLRPLHHHKLHYAVLVTGIAILTAATSPRSGVDSIMSANSRSVVFL